MLSCPLQPGVNLGASPEPGTKGIHRARPGSGCWAPEQKHCHLEAHCLAWERSWENLAGIPLLPRHPCGRELSEGTGDLRFGRAAWARLQEISVIIAQRALRDVATLGSFFSPWENSVRAWLMIVPSALGCLKAWRDGSWGSVSTPLGRPC